MRTERFSLLFLFGLFFLFLLNSCEDRPDVIGVDLLPGKDIFTISFDSLGIIQGYTITSDSVLGNFKATQILGSQVDPYFGFSKAELIAQIIPSLQSGSFGTNPVTDSVILFLPISEIVGIGSAPLRVNVYEYTDSISRDSAYYSGMDITGKYRDQLLGASQITENDSVIKVWITDTEFVNKFLTAENDTLNDAEYFKELVSGLYITCDDAVSEGDGGYIILDWANPNHNLVFYYHNDSSNILSQIYQIGQAAVGINLFSHDHSGHPIEPFINNGSVNDSILFLQSMGGLSSVIKIVGLLDWKEDSIPVAIIDARLVIKVVDTNITQQKYIFSPPVLKLLRYSEGIYKLNYDDILVPNGAGGNYDSETNSYIFNLRVHIQAIIQGDLDSEDLILKMDKDNEAVSRTVLHRWSEDPDKRMKLEITYTRL